MNAPRAVLLACGISVFSSISLVFPTSAFAVRALQRSAPASSPYESSRTAGTCSQYGWQHVGHPEKGYNRRVCLDKPKRPLARATQTDSNQTDCKKRVLKHFGPPGKGIDTFRLLRVPCGAKR